MAYNENNSEYKELVDEERELLDLEGSERSGKILDVLAELDDKDVYDIMRDFMAWDGSFDNFVDYSDFSEYVSTMTDGKSGNELVRFIMDVAKAVNEYDGSDVEYAAIGYERGLYLVIKDWEDVYSDCAEYADELADHIINDPCAQSHADLPSEITDMLDLWEREDDGEFEYEAEDEDE